MSPEGFTHLSPVEQTPAPVVQESSSPNERWQFQEQIRQATTAEEVIQILRERGEQDSRNPNHNQIFDYGTLASGLASRLVDGKIQNWKDIPSINTAGVSEALARIQLMTRETEGPVRDAEVSSIESLEQMVAVTARWDEIQGDALVGNDGSLFTGEQVARSVTDMIRVIDEQGSISLVAVKFTIPTAHGLQEKAIEILESNNQLIRN